MSHLRRHPNEDPALEQMIRSMDEFARHDEAEHLTETSKAKHRADLLALASSTQSSSSSAPSSAPQPSRPRILWSKRAFAFASALAVLVLVLNLTLSGLSGRRSQTVARLLVPAAQSAEAFSLQPVEALPGGIDARAGWTLKASVPVSREAIEKAIRLDPPVPVRVEKAEGDAWRVIPEEALAANAVYKITLAAALETSDQQIPYEYSWVNQTVGEFRAEAFTPGPGASGVPVTTGIEITFSHEGFADPSAFFSVSPKIEGRFETRGRTLVFMPAKPLTAGKVYTVTLKQGFGYENHPDMQLKKDLVYAFQTSLAEDHQPDIVEFYLPLSSEVRPSAPMRIPVPAGMSQDYTVDAKVYRVSADEAKRYIAIRGNQFGAFAWSSVQREEVATLVEGKSPILTRERMSRSIEQKSQYYQTSAVELPGQSAGFYLVSLANSADPRQKATPDWTLVQVSDLALQLIADRDRVLVWVVNSSLKRPVSGATVKIGDTQVTTSMDGTAMVPLPATFFDRSAAGMTATVDVAQDGQETFALLQPSGFGIGYGLRSIDPYAGNRDTWTYLYVDRRVQRSDDTLNLFGLALDRGTKHVPAGLKLRIVPSGYFLYEDYRFRTSSVVIDEQPVQADAYGRFQASFTWKDRRAGTYEVQVMRGSSVVASSFFEIRNEAKPTTALEASFDRPYAYAGEVVTGRAQASYTDGTRLPNAEVVVEVRRAPMWETLYRATLTTDDRGEVQFRVPTRGSVACSFGQGWATGSCGNTESLTVTARLATASEGEVVRESSMTLLPSALFVAAKEETVTSFVGTETAYAGVLPATARQDGSKLTLSGKVLNASISGNEVRFASKAQAAVTADVYVEIQERTQTGTMYNDVTKRVEPTYTYRNRIERIDSRALTTDEDGVFAYTLTVDEQASHQVVFTVVDARGRRTTVHAPVYRDQPSPASITGGTEQMPGQLTLTYTKLRPTDPDTLPQGDQLGLNESADMKAVLEHLPANAATKPLFVTSARGIQRVSYGDENFKVVMDEASVPLLSVYAIVFTETEGFKVANVRFALEQKPYKLDVDVRSDKNDYAPGEQARFTARVMGADGKPVAGTKVLLSVADKALEALYGFNQTNVVSELYTMYQDGIETSASTHKMSDQFGGAEGGGGGPGDILMRARRNFNDQAAFVIGETSANGEVVLDVTMPDNLTTWRIQAVAISTDLRGGETLITRVVRKPLAIDAVIPRVLVAGDKAEVRLQPMTDDLASDADVEYAIDAQSLGLNAQVIHGKGRAAVHIPFMVTEAMRGTHTIKVGIRVGGRQDAMEQTLEVIEPSYTRTIWESAPSVSPGFVLPENRGNDSSILLTSRARGALLVEAQDLFASKNSGARLEAILAARMTKVMIQQLGVKAEAVIEPNWSDYQELGMKPLPQSSANIDATLATLYSQQAVGDRTAMRAYLSSIYDSSEATRELRLKAAVGLALMGQPTIDALHTVAQASNLTWREEAVLLRGLVALGARDEAKAILTRWEHRFEERDGQAWIKISDVPSEITEATRVATYAAYALANEHREAYQSYLAHNRDKVSYDPVFDGQILALRIAQAPNEQAVIVYRLGEKTEEVNLNEGVHYLGLNPDEWSQFSVVSVQGPVSIQWQRRVPGVPENTPGMAITRSYRALNTTQIKEGDLVQVTLTPTFSKRDTHGCYEIRDRLPANLTPVLNWQIGYGSWWPVKQDDGSLSFVSCGSYSDVITYTTRVTVAGTYSAPLPVVQHLEQPSLSAVGVTTSFSAGRK